MGTRRNVTLPKGEVVMSFKVILAPVSGGDGDRAVLDAALGLARRFDAHVRVLHVKGDPRDAIPFLGEGASGALIEQIMTAAQRDSEERKTRARQTYDKWRAEGGLIVAEKAGASGPSTWWQEESGTEEDWIARCGRLADVTVVPLPGNGAASATIEFESALLDTGKPVISVPGSGAGAAQLANSTVLIAWNGSPQSAMAIGAALPLISSAPRVVALALGEGDKAAADIGLLTGYLAWHGIKAEGLTRAVKTLAAGPIILTEAAQVGAGLLVMGAYTHSRVKQMVFGGVTRHVLTSAGLPVLMAH
jgi:nucleotide-binding universal stress UspA family protein